MAPQGTRVSAKVFEPEFGDDKSKLAEITARALEAEIVRRGWPVGKVLGSEAELLDTHKVSRSILREAIRLLEHHRVAEMRRGPGGGLVIREPESDGIIQSVALYLEYARVQPRHLYQVRLAIELDCVEQACERIDEAGMERLRQTVAIEEELQGRDPRVHDFHVLIAELSENPASKLFVETLAQLTSWHRDLDGDRAEIAEARRHAVSTAHRRIAEAIIDGDVSLAKHRMKRHLSALAAVLE